MSNAMNVNAEGNPTDRVLARIHQSMPDRFNPRQWKMISEAGVASSDEYDFDIRQAMEEKVTTMFVPTPDEQMAYSVYKLENGNPFQILKAMDFVMAEIPFEQAKWLITVNLTWGWRDVVVLFPNPRTETADLYILREQKEWDNLVDTITKNANLILWEIINRGTTNKDSCPVDAVLIPKDTSSIIEKPKFKVNFNPNPDSVPSWIRQTFPNAKK